MYSGNNLSILIEIGVITFFAQLGRMINRLNLKSNYQNYDWLVAM